MDRWDLIREATRQGIQDGLRDAGLIVLDKGSQVIARDAIDESTLLESGEVEEVSHKEVVVKWTAEHAKYVFFGTRPHWPPDKPIREWVKRNIKKLRSGDIVVKPVVPSAKNLKNDEIDEWTWRIRAKIAKTGTDPVPFATAGVDEARRRGSVLVRDGINESLRRVR